MNCPQIPLQPLVFTLLVAGSLLALVTALAPQATGAWYLAAGYLVCGLLPYVVYGSLLDVLDDCTLVVAGGALLAADLLARTGAGITAAANGSVQAALWLSLFLILLVLPLGVTAGKLVSRMARG